jgi:hypothetical protein
MVTLDVYIVGLQTALQKRALGFSQQMLFDQFPSLLFTYVTTSSLHLRV